MSDQPRVIKVLAALLVSMTFGAVVLMALSGRPPHAGPFSLASYIGLAPISESLPSRAVQQPERWRSIEVYFSGTAAGNIEQLALLYGLAGEEDLNCHFVVCNGAGGDNGQVLPTARWQRQWSTIPNRAWNGPSEQIRICVIADGATTTPTEYQIKRTYTLIEKLCQKFNIPPKAIYYPENW
ncbi:MAG: N-acetylmuramoyl-L-alanine amidase [Planctomycetota bacterium]|jgi:hypothetical protein